MGCPIRGTTCRRRRWLGRSCIRTALMKRDDIEMGYVGTGMIPVLGGALWRPSGPETAATKWTWKETLGWDDSLGLSTPIHGHLGQRS